LFGESLQIHAGLKAILDRKLRSSTGSVIVPVLIILDLRVADFIIVARRLWWHRAGLY